MHTFKLKSNGNDYWIIIYADNITDALKHIASKNGIYGDSSLGEATVWIEYRFIDGIERMIQ